MKVHLLFQLTLIEIHNTGLMRLNLDLVNLKGQREDLFESDRVQSESLNVI